MNKLEEYNSTIIMIVCAFMVQSVGRSLSQIYHNISHLDKSSFKVKIFGTKFDTGTIIQIERK